MVETTQEPKAQGQVNGRWVIAGLAALFVVVVGYFVLGMPGMNHGGSGMAGMDTADMAVGVEDFERRMAEPDAFVVNVHVPDEGSIAGTDATISYDRVVGDDRLPDDRSTPILVYCKTGRMSADAATALMDAGYRDVAYLDGGMDAWQAAGRRLM